MSTRRTAALLSITTVLLVSSCAGLTRDYETPSVNVSSLKVLPGEGVAPRFEIGLHIVNPNRTPLELKGVAYTIQIEGHDILTGVSNRLPVIEAYGEGDVTLYGSVNLFSSIALFTALARNQPETGLSYSLDAKLDVGTYHPVIRVNKKGTLNFDTSQ